jgi:HSP20 family molecular chaperone IbpA
MSALRLRDPRTLLPDIVELIEVPFTTLRPYLPQAIRVEDYAEGDHYVIRAELAGIDPDKDVEVTAGSGHLTIRAERQDKADGRHRSEFRYGSFSRSLRLPSAANEDDITADYRDGILTVSVGLRTGAPEAAKRIEVKA